MPENLTVQPPLPVEPTQLTYAALLEQQPDMHPDLRVHVERLAAGAGEPLPGAVTGEQLMSQVEPQAVPPAATAEIPAWRAEISPEHHERHLEIASFVPDIDKLSPVEQDEIGETIEIGWGATAEVADSSAAPVDGPAKLEIPHAAEKSSSDLPTAEQLAKMLPESIGQAIDSLRAENGEFGEEAASVVTQLAKHLLVTGESPYGIAQALTKRPQLAEQIAAYATTDETSDWDKATAKVVLGEAAGCAMHVYTPRSAIDDWNDEPSGPSPEEVAQAELAAKHFTDLEQAIHTPARHDKSLLQSYGRFEPEGVSAQDAQIYEDCSLATPDVEHLAAADVKFVGKGYAASSEVSKALLKTHDYDPANILRADTLFKGLQHQDKESEPMSEMQLKEAEQLADMLHCGKWESPESAAVAREAITDLIGRGASVEGLLHVFGGQTVFDKFQVSELGEQLELAKDLIATLASYPELTFDSQGTGRVVEELTSNPAEYQAAVATIETGLREALASGYPADLASEAVAELFSVYFINSGKSYGNGSESWGQMRANYLNSRFEAMKLLGPTTQELLRLTKGREPDRDDFASRLSRELYRGDTAQVADLRTSIIEVTGNLRTLAEDQPEVYAALLKSHAMMATGDLQEINAYTGMAQKLAERGELMAMLPPGDSTASALEGVVNRVAARMDPATKTFPEGLFSSLDQLQRVLQSDTRFKGITLEQYFVGQTNAEVSEQFADLLLSSTVQELMGDEQMAVEVNLALSTMRVELGRYDFPRAAETCRAINQPLPGLLGELIRAQADLGKAGPAVQKFYEIAPRILSRLDKDGNPYDSAESLRQALKPLNTRYNEGYEDQLDWYLGDELPVAAIDSVLYFREQAAAAGIVDSPRSIYEWVHNDPEKISELSHRYLVGYLTKALPYGRGKTPETLDQDTAERLIKVVGEEIGSMENDFRLFLNVSPQALGSIVAGGGAIKSMLDAGVTVAERTTYYRQRRSGVEIALGIRSMEETEDHPIYGSCGYIGDGVPSGAVSYGDIMLSFGLTPDRAAHTSFTPEDSFHGAYRLTAHDAQVLRAIKSGRGDGHLTTHDYVEFQYRGVLDLNDVEQMYAPNEELAAQLRDVLPPDLQGKITVRASEGTYAATRERALYQSVVSNT